ncbi:DNA polymerase beta superfamily protein [Moraxella nonliquefaciens]|uniref:Nucleotidyltransferase n=1 Tax=Moraxella nonliquefaciens TaxID=478 RepID=A0A1B8QJ44_MORNO|nr:nucleotidyltransferase domain-containing protein [Moraxella nonliquefaciens]OBX83490.1 nucleotidyltransferase [Moraxella nonliquefaciens]QPT44012.1 nucleotidyltransferase domain-containing protein [Moraxella nonliquefaciens]QQC29031.1 nucleotidyltransferase domain-containing protein [Moraxella nonliquefaciens]
MITIDYLKANNLILLECISGSRTHGLDTPSSDIDIKGVFYLPKPYYYGLHDDYVPQVSNETNDVVYYELGRFVDLLLQNNPNIMELLATPSDKILYKHPIMDKFNPDWFISKLCQKTFAGFALSQIKKSRGLNKKIVNPMSKDKKSLLEFCVVFDNQKSVDLIDWLNKNNLTQSQIGLSKMPHASHMYAMFVGDYRGIIHDDSQDVLLSSIPKDISPIAYLSFNQMGYSKYCQDYKEYWKWVEKRNHERYESTVNHGKGYDAKNIMHTFRLLYTALDIAKLGKVIIKRDNRGELLAIKSGQFDYDDLLQKVDELIKDVELAFDQSDLPEIPEHYLAIKTLIKIREQLYG